MSEAQTLLGPVSGAEFREVGGVRVDTFRAGSGRVKRMIYPAGFNWGTHLRESVGTDLCNHAHVGFLAYGEIHVRFQDGCIEEFRAPQFVSVEPGHEGWVVGTEPAVLIEFDFESDTVEKLGVELKHQGAASARHAGAARGGPAEDHSRYTEGSSIPGPRESYPFTK